MDGEAGFLSFARQALQTTGQAPAKHHELLIDRLQSVADAECDRLMVQMPPGSAKSTYGSVLFPAYFFKCYPASQIIATAHTASLANYFGRHVRNAVVEYGELLNLEIARESRAAGQFALKSGGEYFAAGVRGPITGRRADLIIIDDPVKSWAEAESLTFRDALYDWYRAELSARLKPGGRIVLIMTRWHEDDLAGRLMQLGGGWTQLKLPALAEAIDPLGRAEGAALWPEWQDVVALERRRHEVGERAFEAIYQQNPKPPGSALFKVENIRLLAEAPAAARSIRAWDLAATLPAPGRNPDYTVGLKLAKAQDGRLVVLDIVRLQASPAQVQAKILAVASADGSATVVALPQDPGQAGLAQVAILKNSLLGFTVQASPETGAKIIRATQAAIQVESRNLWLLAAPWNENFLSELAAFPDSRKDDQVDALSRAVNTLMMKNETVARRVNVSLLGR